MSYSNVRLVPVFLQKMSTQSFDHSCSTSVKRFPSLCFSPFPTAALSIVASIVPVFQLLLPEGEREREGAGGGGGGEGGGGIIYVRNLKHVTYSS